MPKHPDIKVYLTNRDGNAFAILARCKNALTLAGLEDIISARPAIRSGVCQ